MKKPVIQFSILLLVFLLCFTFSCKKQADDAGTKAAVKTAEEPIEETAKKETMKLSIPLDNILFGSAVIGAVIRILWFLISELIKWLKFINSSKKDKDLGVKLNNLDFDCLKKEEVKLSCLLVRYGTDDYIKSLASEQDKYEGRLQNKIIELDFPKENSSYELKLPIPIHKRIGTQFKCFVEPKKPKEKKDENEVKRTLTKIKGTLKKCDDIDKIDISASPNQNRVYFLIKKFPTVKTVDKLRNNFCFPK